MTAIEPRDLRTDTGHVSASEHFAATPVPGGTEIAVGKQRRKNFRRGTIQDAVFYEL